MRRVVVLALLALALPMAAWADGITLTNQFGSISISTSGISSIGSQLTSFNGIVAPAGHSLGTVSFTTGTLTCGSWRQAVTFSATGSTFIAIGKGNYGEPKGTIFNGSFVGPITWTLLSGTKGGTQEFALTGTIEGMLYTGRMVTGTTTQDIFTDQRSAGQRNRTHQTWHDGDTHSGARNARSSRNGTGLESLACSVAS